MASRIAYCNLGAGAAHTSYYKSAMSSSAYNWRRMAHSRTWQATLCAWALVCLATALCAEPIKQLKPTGYVNDFAGVLDASSSESIRNICQQIDQKAKAQIAIVTIHSLDGAEIESYASDLYKAWGIG